MNIAFIVSQFPLLSESFVVRQIVDLLESGHDVRIVAFSKSGQNETQKEVQEFHLIDRTDYVSLPEKKWKLRFYGLSCLIRCFVSNPKAAFRLLCSYKSAAEFSYSDIVLLRLFLRMRCDVVHAHFGPNGIRSLCLKKAIKDIVHITTFHGYDVSVVVRREGKEYYNDLFRIGDCFTYNSESTKQKLLASGCPEDKMVKLPMGIDVGAMPCKTRRLNSSEKVRLLSVGRLVEMKGREYAIRAAARLSQRYAIQYDIVGDGPLRGELQDLIEELNVSDSITLRGWISSDQLKTLYQQAHLFIHPSVTSSDGNQEGQGVVLLEAQAYGIPVIATRHGAFPESMVDGLTGYLVSEKDVDGLSAAIEDLILKPEVWPRFGEEGRKFAVDNFDAKKLCCKLVDIYRQQCSGLK